MLLPSLVQVSESISVSVVPLAMFSLICLSFLIWVFFFFLISRLFIFLNCWLLNFSIFRRFNFFISFLLFVFLTCCHFVFLSFQLSVFSSVLTITHDNDDGGGSMTNWHGGYLCEDIEKWIAVGVDDVVSKGFLVVGEKMDRVHCLVVTVKIFVLKSYLQSIVLLHQLQGLWAGHLQHLTLGKMVWQKSSSLTLTS